MRQARQFKFLQEWTDKLGRKRLRFRRRGFQRIELPGPIGSETFVAAYVAACRGEPRPEPETYPGVYLLLIGDEIVYVGASRNMHARVGAHRRNGRLFEKALFIACKSSECSWLEKLLIEKLKPKQNRAERKNVPTRPAAKVLKFHKQ